MLTIISQDGHMLGVLPPKCISSASLGRVYLVT